MDDGNAAPTLRQMGHTGLHISPIGLGCMQFSGPGIVSKFFPQLPQTEVDQIVRTGLDGGITWFDTAEMYGWGHSERSLSTALVHNGISPGEVTIATKWSPLLRTARSVGRTIGARQAALEPFPVDLHQIHMGFGSFSRVATQVHAMATITRCGKTRVVGVSNFSARQMERAHATLATHGLGLATNQVRVNLLHRNVESDGVLDTARRLGITLIAYSPLAGGMLTGKFHDDRTLVAKMPPTRRIYGFTEKRLDRTTPLIEGLREIGVAHGATVSQVALAWLITNYGETMVAIPGASRPHHALEAAQAMRVMLTADETQRLNLLSDIVAD